MPSNWLLWDRIRALARSNRIYQAERIFQDQSQLERIVAGSEFLDFSQQAAVLDVANTHINRLQRYKDYEMMDQTGEVNLALDLYADEGSLCDPERKHTIIIRAKNKRIKKELEELYFGTLLWDSNCRPCLRYLCKFGDCPYEVVTTKNRDGVAALRHMNVYNFTRVETKYGDLVGFFHHDEVSQEPVFLHPWQCMHLRLSSLESVYAPYGRAVIDGGRKAFKQLRLMEDAALIYRITRAPEKRKFKIPVGLIPPKEVPEYMQMIARQFKRQRFYNPATNTFDERYSPLIQEDDFFLPMRPDGTGPDIDTLPGAENLGEIADIEYFKKKMIAPTKIPFARVGIGEGAGQPFDKSLSSTSAEFAKAVQWVQREVATGLTKIGIIHLALRGYTVDDLKGFQVTLVASSAIEELYRIETWQTRAGVMADLKELGWFPKEWIVTHFTDLTPDEIEELKEMEETAAGAGGQGGGGGGGLGLGGPPPDAGGEDILAGGADAGGEGAPAEGDEGDHAQAAKKPANEEDILADDADYERRAARVLREYKERERKRRRLELLTEWVERRNRFQDTHSQFQYLLDSKELDGLSRDTGGQDRLVLTEDIVSERLAWDDEADHVLVGWSVDRDDREAAVKETLGIICEARVAAGADEADGEAVTENDLPS